MILNEAGCLKISIIIPVYNVAKYLCRCLDSCVDQTLQEIEIIVVNDCSPDPIDAKIMQEYEDRYPHLIRCIWHKENKKMGGARNSGISVARGEYLAFVDSDDFIEPDLCEKLYIAAKENDADYAYCDHYEVRGENRKRIHRYNELDADNEQNLHQLCVAWGSLTKREVFFNYALKYPEGLNYAEDVPVTYLILMLANKVIKLRQPLYNYCIRSGSAIQSSTIYDRIPWTYAAFNQTRELCRNILNDVKLFEWDTKVILWLFDYFFLFYGYDHKNNIGMYMEHGYKNNIGMSREHIHKNNINMFLEYVRKNNIDMPMVMQNIKNDYRRARIQFLWDLLNQQKDSLHVQAALLDYDVFYISQRLKQLGFADKAITVWGSGERGRRMGKYLQRANISFSVVDINTNRHGCMLMDGVPIDSWEQKKDSTDIVIATPKLCYQEIRNHVDCSIPVIDMEELLK